MNVHLSSLFLTCLLSTMALGHQVRIGPGTPHATIAEGLAAARDGDTLVIAGGHYPENGLVVEKSVVIRGESGAVLDAGGGPTILEIRADDVSVSYLTFRNVGVNHLREHAAVWIMEARRTHIGNSRFENTFFGVYGLRAVGSVIRDNVLEGMRTGELANGNGLHFWKSDSITITGNAVRGHRDGIYLEFTGHSNVSANACELNTRYGLHFMYAHDNTYRGNTFRRNGAGVAVMYSDRVNMSGNRFEHNWGPASYGLLLKSLRASTIEDNVFHRNTVAIFQEGSNDLTIRGNMFRHNGWALRILANSDRNHFENNVFQANTFDVAYNPSPGNTNTFIGNSWDRYAGWDLDRDGTGDVPHRPVEFFPSLLQNHPPAAALLRSHFVSVLNLLEKLFPTLTPASLEDPAPRMPVGQGRGTKKGSGT